MSHLAIKHPWQLLLAAAILATSGIVEGALTFQPFESTFSCADGSQAGIYSSITTYLEDSISNNALLDKTKHVIFFEGGGACTSPEDCLREFKSEPYKFSSSTLPAEITGETILAEDTKAMNPFQNYTKWLVPYCTQDLYLGDIETGYIGGFVASGSALFTQAINHWQETVRDRQQQVEHLAIIGTSAGAIGVMNHISTVQEAAQTTGVTSVLYILDSASLSDRYDDKNFTKAMETYVDLSEHPLCDPANYFSKLYSEVTDLPCCLSTHCMLRHDEKLARIGSGDRTIEGSVPFEDILLLDSAYDPFSIFASKALENGQKRFADIIGNIWNVAEAAGSRTVRSLETSAAVKALVPKLGPRVHWIVSSCVTHGFFIPSVELMHRACHYGEFQEKEYDLVCRDDGLGVRTELELVSMRLTLWLSTETWKLATIQGVTVRAIVSAFAVHDEAESGLGFSNDNIASHHLRVFVDKCHGPNCVEKSGVSNQCQSLIELEASFDPIAIYLKTIWYAGLAVIILSVALRRAGRGSDILALQESETHRADSAPQNEKTMETRRHKLLGSRKAIWSVQGLNISIAATGVHLLKDIGIKLHAGSIVALMGRSGSGKTTLLKYLSHHRLRGLVVSADTVATRIEEVQKAYLRQGDSVRMENMVACEYLAITALIYGADKKRTIDSVRFVRELFSRARRPEDTSAHEESMVADYRPPAPPNEEGLISEQNLFCDVKIRNLSGGQRRILAIAVALLMAPSLVLLDEPLSGLDSASSILLMDFVQYLSTHHGCTIVMSLHQPSHSILDYFNRVIVLESGILALDENLSSCRCSKILANDLDSLLSKFFHQSSRSSVHQIRRSCETHYIADEGLSDVESETKTAMTREEKGLSAAESKVSDDAKEMDSSKFVSSFLPAKDSFRDIESKVNESMQSFASDILSSSSKSGTKRVQQNAKRDELDEKSHSEDLNSSTVSKDRASVREDDTKRGSCGWFHLTHLREVAFLCRRLHCNYNSDILDLVSLPIVFALFAMVLRFDDGSPVQEVLVSTFYIGIPVNLFRHKIHLSCKMWTAHRLELDDGRISLLSYQIASQSFSFSIPILSVIVAHLVGYAALGWSLETLPVQVLFSATHLLVALQFGRMLCVFFRGDYRKFSKFFSIYIFLSFLFGGLLVATRKLPPGLSWLYIISFSFWAISGAALNQLGYHSREAFCVDAISCIAFDGSFLSRYLGFAPISTEQLALLVLSAWFIGLAILEYVLLRHQCAAGKLFLKRKERVYQKVEV